MSYGDNQTAPRDRDFRVRDDAPSVRATGIADPDDYATKRKVEAHLHRTAMLQAPCGGLTAAEMRERPDTALSTLVDRLVKACIRASDLASGVETACDRALGVEPQQGGSVDTPMPNGHAIGLVNMGHDLLDRLGRTFANLDEQVQRLNRLV